VLFMGGDDFQGPELLKYDLGVLEADFKKQPLLTKGRVVSAEKLCTIVFKRGERDCVFSEHSTGIERCAAGWQGKSKGEVAKKKRKGGGRWPREGGGKRVGSGS